MTRRLMIVGGMLLLLGVAAEARPAVTFEHAAVMESLSWVSA